MPRRKTWRCAALAATAAGLLVTPHPAGADATPSRTHVVAPGETLSEIADNLGVDAAALVTLNGLDDANLLIAGQPLKLPGASPSPPSPTGSYTVVDGDTLWSIAHRFATSVDTLAQANHLDDPGHLALGAQLVVPASGAAPGSPPPAPSPPQPSSAASPAAALPPKPSRLVAHTVQAGETLNQIAHQFGVRAGAIAQASGLDDPDKLPIGLALKVPLPATPAPSGGGATVAAAAVPSAEKPVASAAAATVSAPSDGLVGAALKLVGTPYLWGGSSPSSGFDCSGLVWYVARQTGRSISRGLQGQYNSGPHPARDELKPGDLVFFQNTYKDGLSHNGIYIGGGRFVSAVNEGTGVTTASLSTPYWTSRWFGATRLP